MICGADLVVAPADVVAISSLQDNQKAEQEKARRSALRKQQEEQMAVISQFTQGREARAQRKFQEWCAKKEVAKKKRSKTAKLSVFTGILDLGLILILLTHLSASCRPHMSHVPCDVPSGHGHRMLIHTRNSMVFPRGGPGR